MKLWIVRRDWEKFARLDPLWAVLNEPGKIENAWDTEAFFRTGQDEVNTVMTEVKRHCPEMTFDRALDFGCGVGRATQALADHFSSVVGVDISREMVIRAERLNRHGTRVGYIRNTRGDLACFNDASFDFVHSVITLQHIPPPFSLRYIAEFARILRPGGLGFFQAPFRVRAGDPIERLQWSMWPPTLLKRIRRILIYRWRSHVHPLVAKRPPMAMYALSRDIVVATVQESGTEIIDASPHSGAGDDCPSYGYLIRKRTFGARD